MAASNTNDRRSAGIYQALNGTGGFNANSPTASGLLNSLNGPSVGTNAAIGGSAIVTAGGAITVNAVENLQVTLTQGGFAAGVAGLGGGIGVVTIASNVSATAGGTLSAGGALNILSSLYENVDDTAFAGAAGLVGLGAAVVVVTDVSTTTAGLSDNAIVHNASNIDINATANQNITAHTAGAAVAGIGLGASFTKIDVHNDSTTDELAFVGKNVMIGQSQGDSVGGLSVAAVSNVMADGTAFGLSAGVFAAGANFSYVTVKPAVESRIGSGSQINTTGDVSVTAASNHNSAAKVSGIAGGLAGFGASVTQAHADGSTTAHIDGSIANGSSPGADNVTVQATSGDTASANSQATTGGFVALTSNQAEATVQPSVSAYIASNGNISASSNISVLATENPEGDAVTKGVTVGLAALSGSASTSTVQPNVTSYLMASSVHAGTGNTNNITVNATDAPVNGHPPTYNIDSTNPTNDTLQVQNNGLQTGDVVQYDPNGNQVIGGLQATAPSGLPSPNDTQPRLYNVINVDQNGQFTSTRSDVDPNNLALGSLFDGSNGVDPTTSTIHFASPHNFQTGDQVIYVPSNGATPVGGLTSGTTYYVLVVDPLTIKLTTYDPTVNTTHNLQYFTPVTGNTIHLPGHGFTNGEAVTYHAPAAHTFSSGQVNVNGNPANTIEYVDQFFDAAGNPEPAFANGDVVQYNTNGTSIGGLTAGQNYKVVNVNANGTTETLQLEHTVTTSLTFGNNGSNDTIRRNDGGNWTNDGFANNQTITVSGTASNDRSYTIQNVSGDTLILTSNGTVTGEGPETGTVDGPVIALNTSGVSESVTHSLTKVGDLSITTGGASMDGQRFYVVDPTNDPDNFGLSMTPGGPALSFVVPAGKTNDADHLIGPESIDLSAGAGSQVLRIAIIGSTVDITHGPQKLDGPGGVPLNLISPVTGTGISSVVTDGSGLGVVSGSLYSATITDSPTVKAYVSSGLATAGGDVSITGISTTHATANTQNGSGGLVSIGEASSQSDQTIDNEAYVDSGTHIVAGGNFTLSAKTTNQSDAATQSFTGGVIGSADAHVQSTIGYTTDATVKDDADVLAGGAVQVTATSSTSQTTNAHASGIGWGGNGSAEATSTINSSPTKVEVGNSSTVTGRTVLLSATVPHLYVDAHSEGYGAGVVSFGRGTSNVNVTVPVQIRLDSNGAVTGYEGVDFVTKYGTNDPKDFHTQASSLGRSSGLFGEVEANSTNNTYLETQPAMAPIICAAGSTVTAGPRDPSDPAAAATGLDHLALYIDTTNGDISDHSAPHSPQRRSLAADNSSDPKDNLQTDTDINFNSNVVILSGRSPELVIDKYGSSVSRCR
jgi:hypothetical protein